MDQDSNQVERKNISQNMTLSCYEPIWRKNVHEYNKIPLRNKDYLSFLDEMKIALQKLSPVKIFEEIVTPQIYDVIAKESVNLLLKNKLETLTVEDLNMF